MITEDALADELVGRELPAGEYKIQPYLAWLVADAVESPQLVNDLAHPMFTYFAAQDGIGITLDELFEMAHATADDGIMLGTAELDIVRPLAVGQRFAITGTIEGVVRKYGTSGTFDIISYRHDLLDRDTRQRSATLTLDFIYPRQSAESGPT